MSVVGHVDALTGELRQRMSYDVYGRMRLHLNADFDGDGRVNEDDLWQFNNAYLGEYDDGNGGASADVNGDGVVNEADLDLFTAWYEAQSVKYPAIDDVRVAYHGYIPEHAPTLSSVGMRSPSDATEVMTFLGRMRWYDANLGRWLTRDPAGYVDGLNVYQFVRSNPLMFVDPTGLDSDAILRADGTSEFRGNGLLGDREGVFFSPFMPMAHTDAVEKISTAPLRAINSPAGKRVLGSLQAVGGGLAIIAGVATAKLGIGIPTAAWGLDQLQAGVRQVVTGESASTIGGTLIGEGLQKVGVPAGYADAIGEGVYGLSGGALTAKSASGISKQTTAQVAKSENAMAAVASQRQTMATGRGWYDDLASKYGDENVEWVSGSGRTIHWPKELPPVPDGVRLFRVNTPARSGTFADELAAVAGPRPDGFIAHHVAPLSLNGVDNGAVNGSWVLEQSHKQGHNILNPVIKKLSVGTELVPKP